MRFNSQPPEGGWDTTNQAQAALESFNSQPPEGGWRYHVRHMRCGNAFQLTAARRRLVWSMMDCRPPACVSTHSRPKAAEPLATSTKAA